MHAQVHHSSPRADHRGDRHRDRGARSGGAGRIDLKIGVVTDVGTIDDRNFNQYTWEGALAGAEAVGAAEPQYAISAQSADIGPNIQAFVDQGYDVIVTIGFAAGADTINAALANPDMRFIGIDQAPCINEDGTPDDTFTCAGDPAVLLPNVQGINWREQQPGYLAGIVAASVSKTGHIAAVGGTAVIPAVVNYIEGYANGAKSINPDAVVTVTYVSGAPDAAAFNDPAGGQAIAQQLLAQDPDIDVMFQVAGKTGNGVLQAACDASIYGIGVDVDQFISTPETAACTIVSAEKKLTKNVSRCHPAHRGRHGPGRHPAPGHRHRGRGPVALPRFQEPHHPRDPRRPGGRGSRACRWLAAGLRSAGRLRLLRADAWPVGHFCAEPTES